MDYLTFRAFGFDYIEVPFARVKIDSFLYGQLDPFAEAVDPETLRTGLNGQFFLLHHTPPLGHRHSAP